MPGHAAAEPVPAASRHSGHSVAQVKDSPPGRMMASVPARPRATSSQRPGLTRWRSHSAATRVTHSGVVATMAVNSASGMCMMLMNPNRLVAANRAPRRA
jgi:hypothetical protein